MIFDAIKVRDASVRGGRRKDVITNKEGCIAIGCSSFCTADKVKDETCMHKPHLALSFVDLFFLGRLKYQFGTCVKSKQCQPGKKIFFDIINQ